MANDAQIKAWLAKYPPSQVQPVNADGTSLFTFDVFVCGCCTAMHTNLTKHARYHIDRGDT